MPTNAILVVGSLNMDQVLRVPRIPVLGETVLGAGSLKLIPGGKGANQAVAIARLGASVIMAGRVGHDPFGARLVQALQDDHVQTDLIVVDQEESSGVALIFLGPDGNNAIVVASGANMRVGQEQSQLEQIANTLKHVRALVLQLEIPLATVQTLISMAYDAHVPVILNLAPAQPIAREFLQKISVLILNETEAGMLSGQRIDNEEDARIVATVLYGYGISTVVITLGAHGAILVTNDKQGKPYSIYQPAPRVQVVDTTAAGDCFVGSLTVALTEGQTPEEALRFAIHASALKVTRFGAQSGLPTREEVEAHFPDLAQSVSPDFTGPYTA